MLNYYIELSERILAKAQALTDTATIRKELYYIRRSGFESKINTDELKKMFWINIYNSYVLIMANEKLQVKKIYSLKRIKFSNVILSLNDIEYGILKVQKYNVGFSKMRNLFYPAFIKKLALEKKDNTIVAQLNKNILCNTAG
jgi:hypothetical protein